MTFPQTMLRLGWSALALLALLDRPATSQTPGGPNLATRAELQDTLARLQARNKNDMRVRLIRDRLEHGDFRVGDQVYIRVAGEEHINNTFTVIPGPVLPLPEVGDIPLQGVLRSELAPHVVSHIAHYVRDPEVEVRPLIRIMVEGNVAKPGYYALSPDQPLADAITSAGGVTQSANIGDLSVERGNNPIWIGTPLQEALAAGSSLDELMLQAGDRVIVPARGRSWASSLAIIIVTVPAVLYTISLIHF